MRKRFWTEAAVWLCNSAVLVVLMCLASTAQGADKKEAGKELFGLTKVHEFHIEVAAKEYEKMQPTGGFRFPGMPGLTRPEKADEPKKDVHKSRGFGTEFPWVHADFSAGGTTCKDIGLRYKGNGSYMPSTRNLKRNLKIDLDHYDEDQRFQGLKALNLNAGAMDPSRVREALAYAVYRASGVPAPRTAFAEVTITIPGKHNKELLGLYTVVEQVNRTFLKNHFKNNKGLLLKPERVRGLEYLGDNWDRYKDRYLPKHEPTREEAQRLIEFVKLVNRGDAEQFQKEIASYLDIDEFLRFLAATALVANMDSFFTLGHNYYIYLNPDTNKFVFLPWDLDLAFGAFPMSGSSEQQADLSLTHPYGGENKLTDRLLAIKEVREKYQKLLKEISEKSFTKEKLLKDLDAIEKVTKEPLEREKKAVEARKEAAGRGFGPFGGMFGKSMSVRSFLEKRADSVLAQVEGTRKGYVPTSGFGFGGPGGPRGGFGPGNVIAKRVLEVADTDKDSKMSKEEVVAGVKKLFAVCDKDKKGSVDAKALAAELNRLFPPPPGFGPPAGFGVGDMLARSIMKRADSNKDDKLTIEELVAATETLFKEADKEGKGKLDERSLAAGINLLFPPPGGFGGPGGVGGPGPKEAPSGKP